MQTLQAMVYEALDNAKANGYGVADNSIPAIVQDLKECDADLEDVLEADIRPHVEAWLKANT